MVEEKAKDWTGKPDSCLYGPHQWTVEKRPKEWIKKGLTLKLVAILVPLTVLFVAILVLGFYTVFMLKGDAKNINYAGNLRYRSYKLALQVNEYPVLQGGVRDRAHRTILSNMGDFETILYGLRDSHKDLGLKGFKPPPGVKEGVFSYTDPWWQFDRRIKDYNERVRPLILHILNFTNREEAMEALKLYNKNVNDFVTDVDRSVHLLQLLSEEKLSGFKTTEFILLGLFLGIIGASFSLSVFFIRRPLLGILKGAEAFSRGDLNYRVPVRGRDEMGALASGFNTMAETIENNIERLKDSLLDTVRCLSEAIDAKSPWTRGHSDRVAGLSCDIARELGLGEEDIERIRMASL
ncbi:MAG: HAMP domain-containing protein, partial [Candidatus Brocadiales bacterium]|nr:HAMP domain-containing protein [Candidatus Brocadiales bacterium]